MHLDRQALLMKSEPGVWRGQRPGIAAHSQSDAIEVRQGERRAISTAPATTTIALHAARRGGGGERRRRGSAMPELQRLPPASDRRSRKRQLHAELVSWMVRLADCTIQRLCLRRVRSLQAIPAANHLRFSAVPGSAWHPPAEAPPHPGFPSQNGFAFPLNSGRSSCL